MDLTGGIDEHRWGKRYKSEVPPKGRKVRYLARNGYDSDVEYANRFFKKGEILEVYEIYVGSSYSTVEFIKYPGERFNTVMFEDVD